MVEKFWLFLEKVLTNADVVQKISHEEEEEEEEDNDNNDGGKEENDNDDEKEEEDKDNKDKEEEEEDLKLLPNDISGNDSDVKWHKVSESLNINVITTTQSLHQEIQVSWKYRKSSRKEIHYCQETNPR